MLFLGYDAVSWHRVDINLGDFRTMGDASFKLHFRMTRRTFEVGRQLVLKSLITTDTSSTESLEQ